MIQRWHRLQNRQCATAWRGVLGVATALVACAGLWGGGERCVGSEGLDAGRQEFVRQRDLAGREFQEAHRAAESAREVATAAKSELDQFMTAHLAEQPVPGNGAAGAQGSGSPASDAEREWLNGQLQELNARRGQMLDRFTPVHPEIVELEERIQKLSARLAAADSAGLPTGSAAESPAAVAGPSAESAAR